jgi:hypothetical protein
MQNRLNPGGTLTRLLRTGLVAVLVPLAGCATAYQPENLTGRQHADVRLADATYRVQSTGTSRDQAEQVLLYRCAQLTTQLGYDHFILVDQDTTDMSDSFSKAGLFPRNYYATAHIKVLAQADHPAAYNAKEVMRRVEARYPNELGS